MKNIILILILIVTLCGCENSNAKQYASENVKYEYKEDKEDKEEVTVDTVMGESFTIIKDKESNRLDNIALSCSSTTESIIKPNTVFSFNEKTGRRSKATGYKEASVIIDGEHERGIGGGVCQVSSTIHMAAVNSGLEIAERHHHSKPVGYAPTNLDATVVYGKKDLKIKNNTPDDITLYVWTDNENIYAKFVKKTIDKS